VSVTAVGPALALVGPPPKPPEHRLLNVPDVVVDDASSPPRWLTQVNLIGYPAGVPDLWEACSTGTFRTKSEGSARPQSTWNPFAAFFPLLCSSLGLGNYDIFYAEAEAALDATISHSVEDALANGVDTNPFFGDLDMEALANVATAPRVALAMLENAIGSETGRQGLIHATPAVVAAWTFGNQLYIDDDDVLRTYNGTPVASESGIIGSHPHGSGGLIGPGATLDWAFATGPVAVRIESEPRYSIDQTLDRSDNRVVVRAERYVLALWDKALQVGVPVDWSLA
jgi:hypothetical protein